MERARVLDYNLQTQLKPYMENFKPRPSIYIPEFIAANQAERADNVLTGSKQEMMTKIREDIREFKKSSGVDKVIVLWTANTERFSEIIPGVNDTAENLISSIRNNESEVSPSTLFAVASILEGVSTHSFRMYLSIKIVLFSLQNTSKRVGNATFFCYMSTGFFYKRFSSEYVCTWMSGIGREKMRICWRGWFQIRTNET